MKLLILLVAAAASGVFAAAAFGRSGAVTCTPGVKSSRGVTYRTFCGPAHATAKVGGKTLQFTGGKCEVAGTTFTVNLGTISLGAVKPKYAYFGMDVTPAKAGVHTGLISFSTPGKRYSLLHATVKLKSGLHDGTFSGAVLTGGTATGSFSC